MEECMEESMEVLKKQVILTHDEVPESKRGNIEHNSYGSWKRSKRLCGGCMKETKFSIVKTIAGPGKDSPIIRKIHMKCDGCGYDVIMVREPGKIYWEKP